MPRRSKAEAGASLFHPFLCIAVLAGSLAHAEPAPAPLPGRVVFDSNRTAVSFGIYTVAGDGTDLQTLIDSPQHDMYPDPSPCGRWVVYTRAESLERNAPSQLRIIGVDGTNDRLLVEDGAFARFHPETGNVVFSRGRRHLLVMDPDRPDDPPRVLYPPDADPDRHVVLPSLSPDGRRLAYTTDAPIPWCVAYVDLRTGRETVLGEGCEPIWTAGGTALMWISSENTLERTGIVAQVLKTGERITVRDEPGPWGHEYFPWATPDTSILLWSVCPAGSHSHITANYQIFARRIPDGPVLRLTHDRWTNRWPKLIPPLRE